MNIATRNRRDISRAFARGVTASPKHCRDPVTHEHVIVAGSGHCKLSSSRPEHLTQVASGINSACDVDPLDAARSHVDERPAFGAKNVNILRELGCVGGMRGDIGIDIAFPVEDDMRPARVVAHGVSPAGHKPLAIPSEASVNRHFGDQSRPV
jgi:hypothetical protein